METQHGEEQLANSCNDWGWSIGGASGDLVVKEAWYQCWV